MFYSSGLVRGVQGNMGIKCTAREREREMKALRRQTYLASVVMVIVVNTQTVLTVVYLPTCVTMVTKITAIAWLRKKLLVVVLHQRFASLVAMVTI